MSPGPGDSALPPLGNTPSGGGDLEEGDGDSTLVGCMERSQERARPGSVQTAAATG